MAADIVTLNWDECRQLASMLAARHDRKHFDGVYGIPTGGVPVALLVANELALPVVDFPTPATLMVDDLVDSGRTWESYHTQTLVFDALIRKPHSPARAAPGARVVDAWVVFPWETIRAIEGPEDNVTRLLEWIGEDPTRDGLVDTPGRVVRALREMTGGYALDPADVLKRTFDVAHDEMIVVRDIAFASMCEHHMLPFVGSATVGYLPGERIVGLSKIARLVEVYARRLQVQERMTTEIAEAMMGHLDARGVGVIVTATHACMAYRGVGKLAPMVTSAMLGAFRDKPEARAEFLHLAG